MITVKPGPISIHKLFSDEIVAVLLSKQNDFPDLLDLGYFLSYLVVIIMKFLKFFSSIFG